jgi:hypothetical protein
MTQELIDLKNSILAGRYEDALAIVDELEGMSRQAILRNIQSFSSVLVIPLIKNQVEQRLTSSWANSIRSSIREIKKFNLQDNKTSYYVKLDEWERLLEEEIMEDAIALASEEVLNGKYNQFQLSELVNKPEIIQIAQNLLALTYTHSAKELPTVLTENLIQLPGGQDWINR